MSKNIIYLHSIKNSKKYSFELKLKHKEHLEAIVKKQHEMMDAIKYKRVL